MPETTSALGQTIRLFWEIAAHGIEGAYHRLAPKAGVYLKALCYTSIAALITIPTLGILKAVTGYVAFGYLMAVAVVFFTLILGLMWAPLSLLVGLLLGETHSPKTVGEKYVRFVATVMFFELIAIMYISYIPFHRQLDAVPILLIAAVAVALGSAIWGGWLSGRFYTFIALMMVLKITLSALLPQTAAETAKWWIRLDNNMAQDMAGKPDKLEALSQAQARPAPREVRLPVGPGPNGWSRWITEIPPETRPNISTPGDWLEYKFRDGRIIRKSGDRRFYANTQGNSIAPAPIRFPDRDFQIRAGSPGEAIITW